MTGTQGKRDYFYTCLINDEHLREKKYYLNQRVGCLRGYSSVNMNLINIFLKARPIQDKIFGTETGTANQGNIGSTAILNLVIPIPPVNEQKRIVQKVDQLTTLCNELEGHIKLSKEYTEMLMATVLQDAL
jgi:type I restriction enzyme, S subunit